MNNYFLIIRRTGGNGHIHAIHGFKTRGAAMGAKRSLEKLDRNNQYKYTVQDSYGGVVWMPENNRLIMGDGDA